MPDNDRFPFQSLDAYRLARSLAARVHAASIRDSELRDQATRAAKSAFLNLSEGLPSDRPAVRLKFFDSADGSLHEAVAITRTPASGRIEGLVQSPMKSAGARRRRANVRRERAGR